MKKFISLTLAAIFLLAVVAACSRYVPFIRDNPGQTTSRPWTNPPRDTIPQRETQPPRETESLRETEPPWIPPPPPSFIAPRPVPTAPTLPNRFTWHIQPTLWFGDWSVGQCCEFFFIADDDWNIFQIDPYTGELYYVGSPSFGHCLDGGWSHDPIRDVFMYLGMGFGELYTREEFQELMYSPYHQGRLRLIAEFDSTQYTEYCFCYEDFTCSKYFDFPSEAWTGRHAVFFGYEQVTDFIFSFRTDSHSYWNWRDATVIPVQLYDEELIGLVDVEGNIIVPPMFEKMLHIREGGFFVRYQGFYGVINVDGLFENAPLSSEPGG